MMSEHSSAAVGVDDLESVPTRWVGLAVLVLVAVASLLLLGSPADADEQDVPCEPLEFSAGPDQTVNEGSPVTLEGSAQDWAEVQCSDPVDPPVWSQIAGPAVTLSDSFALDATFTAPALNFENTVLTFRLSYDDRYDDVDVTVLEIDFCSGIPGDDSVCTEDPGDPPCGLVPGDPCEEVCAPVPFESSAGPDQTVDEGTLVTLEGEAEYYPQCAEPDGPPVWSQIAGPSVTLSNPFALDATFTAPEVSETTVLTFRLSYDGSYDDVDVTVLDTSPYCSGIPGDDSVCTEDPGDPPCGLVPEDPCGEVCAPVPFESSAGPDQTVDEGTLVTLEGEAEYYPQCAEPVDPPVWSQIAGPSVTLSDSFTLDATFTAPEVSETTVLTFRLSYDGSYDDVDVTVLDTTAPEECPWPEIFKPTPTGSPGSHPPRSGKAQALPAPPAWCWFFG